MIYFKEIKLTASEKEQTENAMRKFAIKQNSPLNFGSSNTNAGTDKLFIGFNGPDDTTFTRIRYFIEGYLPKIIISVPKNDEKNILRFKLDVISTCIFCGATLLFIFSLIVFIVSGNWEDVVSFTLFYTIFISLLLLEIKLTKSSIEKAVRKYNEAEVQKL